MPELPEVETVRQGIMPHLLKRKVKKVLVREHRLRWPVERSLVQGMRGQVIKDITRRAKYLIFKTDKGHAIIHLGMSGSLRVLPSMAVPQKHDHVDFLLDNQLCLRFRDPRRFGCVLWTGDSPLNHPLLRELGPEPLGEAFNANYLFSVSRGKKVSIKSFLMNARIVSGIGNIYANEALFLSGIHPNRAAGRISLKRYIKLVTAIRHVLQEAIRQGGTTLRDFTNEQGEPGYFLQELRVYDRQDQSCESCGGVIKRVMIGQRATYYCGHCQR